MDLSDAMGHAEPGEIMTAFHDSAHEPAQRLHNLVRGTAPAFAVLRLLAPRKVAAESATLKRAADKLASLHVFAGAGAR